MGTDSATSGRGGEPSASAKALTAALQRRVPMRCSSLYEVYSAHIHLARVRYTGFAHATVCCLLITHLLLLGSNAWFKHAFMNIVAEAAPKRFCAFICIQGDANNAPDPEPLMPKQIKGVVVYHLPYVGHIALGIDGPTKIPVDVWFA